MRKVKYSVNDVMKKISTMKGVAVKMKVNLGRNRVVFYDGIIENTYSSLFTVKLLEEGRVVSYSYSDVLCGDVKLKTV